MPDGGVEDVEGSVHGRFVRGEPAIVSGTER